MAKHIPLVLLHGWGFDSRIWQTVLPELQQSFDVITIDLPGFGANKSSCADIHALTANLLDQMPEKSIVLGWSLGGMIATHMAIHYPQRVAALITVSSNLKWVSDTHFANKEWPGAAPDNFAAFFENLAQHFETTKDHFCGVIARGDKNEKTLVKYLRKQLSDAPLEDFLHGLRLLDSIDNREGFKHLSMPGLHLFGEQDVLVPLSVEENMRQLNNKQQTIVFPGLSHAPFLSEPILFVATVKNVINHFPYQIDKRQVAESFSKAAITYDAAAQLQMEIGDQLFLKLTATANKKSRTVLDLGCGTGAHSQKLTSYFPSAQMISMDMAQGMLRVAKDKTNKFSGVRADAESLPFKDNSVDVIFSNLAIQWCQNYRQLLSEIKRVLSPGGLCCISTFQNGTLRELKTAWQSVDNDIHVNEFIDVENFKKTALESGLSSFEMQEQTLVKHYDQVKQLTQELKAIGAHNMNSGRSNGLMGKHKLEKLIDAYEIFRSNDKLPAHYEILYLTFTKE